MNTLKLANETFQVTRCGIWGYLGERDGEWYCRWCIAVECAEKSRTVTEDGESHTSQLKPSMEGNTLPIKVEHWHDLEGVTVNTGPNVDFEYLDPNDSRPIYSIYVHEHSKCSNNSISISNRQADQFRVQWSGTAYTLGTNCPHDEPFALDAIATFTGISLNGEVDDESEVDDNEIARIFSSVFPNVDFQQHPAKIRRIDEDDLVTIDFRAEFTPK